MFQQHVVSTSLYKGQAREEKEQRPTERIGMLQVQAPAMQAALSDKIVKTI
jgi:hypothetical protein